ncbi:MAG: Gfo/Idh/MocA family oxidoreductase [Candidatus Marinimicrobia bacterium]|nr:Gfo/Idh/MocA family oxidoreductase [Candidatus Neomarinimicrobiota bacterium]
MTSPSKNKVCVVGGGKWGDNHIRILNEMGNLGAIVDCDRKTLKSYSKKYPKISTYENLTQVLETGNYSGYIVATPASTHFAIALEIMNSGCHVLVEKPVALNKEDVNQLKITAESNNVNLMAGHVLLFHPGIQKIKEIIDNGIIGDLQYIYSNRLNLGTVRTEENVFWSLAPHDISIFQYFTGSPPTKITSKGGAFLQSQIHDTTITILEYKQNIQGHIFVSWLHPFKEHRLVVVGSQGMITFEDSAINKPLKLYSKGYTMNGSIPKKHDGDVELIKYKDSNPLYEELKYFIDHLDGRELGIANATNAVEVVNILVQASESLMEKCLVE